MAEKMVTYICGLKSGKMRKFIVPESWKVTYGPLVPATRGDHGGCALRIYEGDQKTGKQRAMFRDIEWFRVESIQVYEKTRREKRHTMRQKGKAGERDVVLTGVVEEWEDPDNPVSQDEADDFMKEQMQVIDFSGDTDD